MFENEYREYLRVATEEAHPPRYRRFDAHVSDVSGCLYRSVLTRYEYVPADIDTVVRFFFGITTEYTFMKMLERHGIPYEKHSYTFNVRYPNQTITVLGTPDFTVRGKAIEIKYHGYPKYRLEQFGNLARVEMSEWWRYRSVGGHPPVYEHPLRPIDTYPPWILLQIAGYLNITDHVDVETLCLDGNFERVFTRDDLKAESVRRIRMRRRYNYYRIKGKEYPIFRYVTEELDEFIPTRDYMDVFFERLYTLTSLWKSLNRKDRDALFAYECCTANRLWVAKLCRHCPYRRRIEFEEKCRKEVRELAGKEFMTDVCDIDYRVVRDGCPGLVPFKHFGWYEEDREILLSFLIDADKYGVKVPEKIVEDIMEVVAGKTELGPDWSTVVGIVELQMRMYRDAFDYLIDRIGEPWKVQYEVSRGEVLPPIAESTDTDITE